jgi:hypothetical protein
MEEDNNQDKYFRDDDDQENIVNALNIDDKEGGYLEKEVGLN